MISTLLHTDCYNNHEDPVQVSTVADVVVNADSIARGYLIVKTAKDLGATKFMHISFVRQDFCDYLFASFSKLIGKSNISNCSCRRVL